MNNRGLYILLLWIVVGLLLIVLALSALGKLSLPLPVYFLLLLVFDLGITAFLTGWLNSSAEWSGPLMKGNLKITGAIVVFLLILGAGYRFRPENDQQPFDLTIDLTDPTGVKGSFAGDTLRIELGNSIRNVAINSDGQAVFLDVDAIYRGTPILLTGKIDGFRIASKQDTTIAIPNSGSPVIRIPLIPKRDSILFQGLVIKRNQSAAPEEIKGAVLHFPSFNKTTTTDSLGAFSIYLIAKQGEVSDVKVSKNDRWIFTGEVVLSQNMQILADD